MLSQRGCFFFAVLLLQFSLLAELLDFQNGADCTIGAVYNSPTCCTFFRGLKWQMEFINTHLI